MMHGQKALSFVNMNFAYCLGPLVLTLEKIIDLTYDTHY